MNTEKIKEIIDQVGDVEMVLLNDKGELDKGGKFHALSDLRRIVELEQEVEKLGAMLKDADNYIAELEMDQ